MIATNCLKDYVCKKFKSGIYIAVLTLKMNDTKFMLSRCACSLFNVPLNTLITIKECEELLASYLHKNNFQITSAITSLFKLGDTHVEQSFFDLCQKVCNCLEPVQCDLAFLQNYIRTKQKQSICVKFASQSMILQYNEMYGEYWYVFYIDHTHHPTKNGIKHIKILVDILRELVTIECHVCDESDDMIDEHLKSSLVKLGFDKDIGGYWYPGCDRDAESSNEF